MMMGGATRQLVREGEGRARQEINNIERQVFPWTLILQLCLSQTFTFGWIVFVQVSQLANTRCSELVRFFVFCIFFLQSVQSLKHIWLSSMLTLLAGGGGRHCLPSCYGRDPGQVGILPEKQKALKFHTNILKYSKSPQTSYKYSKIF